MLDCVLSSGPLPADAQRALCDVLLDARDWGGLVLLCAVPDLVDDVDARLGAVAAAEVRRAWVSRPGRTADEVVAALGRERRVSVLEPLAALDVDAPALFEAEAASDSTRVLLALAANTSAPDAVRAGAAARLAARHASLRPGHQDRLRALLTCSDVLRAAALGGLADLGLFTHVCKVPEVSDEVRAHVHDLLSASLAASRDTGLRRAERDSLEMRLVVAVAAAAAADWCDDATAEFLSGLLDEFDDELDGVVRHYLDRTRAVLVRRADGDTVTASHLEVRAAAAVDDDVDALLQDLAAVPAPQAQRAYMALLANGALSVPKVLRAMGTMPFHVRSMADPFELPAAAQAAAVLMDMVTAPYGETADLVLAHLDLAPDGVTACFARLCGPQLSDDQLLALPVDRLTDFLAGPRCTGAVRDRVARLVVDGLSGAPATAWAVFRSMLPGFAGSLRQLLAVCCASQA